ncbi:MAG TPA: rhodanese-like domain-containing protein [Azospirillaceae bacterium]|nr:rhodanese-like domain-containing protein [Azospirillaceae bacterium]
MRISIALILAFLMGSPVTARAEVDTPSELGGARVLSAEELHGLAARSDLRIYDLRKKASFVEGHIPGAISAARHYDAVAEKLDTSFLGAAKAAPIVFYSHGVAGWKSYWAAKAAIEAGYTNVMWFRGGYAEWEEKALPIKR